MLSLTVFFYNLSTVVKGLFTRLKLFLKENKKKLKTIIYVYILILIIIFNFNLIFYNCKIEIYNLNFIA